MAAGWMVKSPESSQETKQKQKTKTFLLLDHSTPTLLLLLLLQGKNDPSSFLTTHPTLLPHHDDIFFCVTSRTACMNE